MITILIPTLDRSPFVERALGYYAALGFSGVISIGDSSCEEHRRANQASVQRYADRLQILYDHFPSATHPHDGCVTKVLAARASTPFLVFSGDDDLLVPRGLAHCVRFLEEHPDYVAAHGFTLMVELAGAPAGPAVCAPIARIGELPIVDLEQPSALARWTQLMARFVSTQYFVHRRETWQRMYEQVDAIGMRFLGPEILPCSVGTMLGRIGQVPYLSTIFQVQPARVFCIERTGLLELMLQPAWSRCYAAVRAHLARTLSATDQLAPERAAVCVDRVLGDYFGRLIARQRRPGRPVGSLRKLRRWAGGRLPGLHPLFAGTRARLRGVRSSKGWPGIAQLLRPGLAARRDLLVARRHLEGTHED